MPMHVADVVIAIAHALRRASGAEGWRHTREDLWTTLRVLDALPIIATEELEQNKKFVIPSLVQLKVMDQRPQGAAKPNASKARAVKACPSRALSRAVLLGGSSSLEPEEEVETSHIPRYRSMGVRLRKEDLEEAPQGEDDGKGGPPQDGTMAARGRGPPQARTRIARGRGPLQARACCLRFV